MPINFSKISTSNQEEQKSSENMGTMILSTRPSNNCPARPTQEELKYEIDIEQS